MKNPSKLHYSIARLIAEHEPKRGNMNDHNELIGVIADVIEKQGYNPELFINCALTPPKGEVTFPSVYHNAECKRLGLTCTCNSCGQIITFNSEDDRARYDADGRGYCESCRDKN